MRFLKYLETLFNPRKMALRKNISAIISFIILLLASYVIAFPYMKVFEKNAYETCSEAQNYNFRVLNDEKSQEIPFTEEEKTKFGDSYVLTTIEELSKLDFTVENGRYKLPESANSLEEVEYNGKILLLKREVYNYDLDGTKTDKVDTYYIHILFDLYDDVNDFKFVLTDVFDKKLNFKDENHFMLAFYLDGFLYRNEYMIDKGINLYKNFEYGKVEFKFSEMDKADYIAKRISKMLVPSIKKQYTYNSFMYTVLAPLILAMVAMMFFKHHGVLTKYKHYFNIVTLSSIPITLIVFLLEWNEFFIRIGIMELYWIILAIYYFIVLKIIHKSART